MSGHVSPKPSILGWFFAVSGFAIGASGIARLVTML
jgi:hypothetical protein